MAAIFEEGQASLKQFLKRINQGPF